MDCSHLLPDVHDGVVPISPDERRIRLDDDAMFLAIVHDILLLAERMELIGVDRKQPLFAQETTEATAAHLDLVHRWQLEAGLPDLL